MPDPSVSQPETPAREASERQYKKAIGKLDEVRCSASVHLLLAIYFELRHQTALIEGGS